MRLIFSDMLKMLISILKHDCKLFASSALESPLKNIQKVNDDDAFKLYKWHIKILYTPLS